AGREPEPVNPAAGQGVHPPIHASADNRVNGSRSGVNAAVNAADSRVKPFTPIVNRSAVNRVNCVNPLVTGTVNGFTPVVKPREFTREPGTVNRPEWSVKQPVQLGVNRAADREQGGVNNGDGTVNPAPDETVNGHSGDREEKRVNDADGSVNAGTVNSRRVRRAHAAKQPAPSSVHAAVGAPSPEETERAEAAAAWFAAKRANPSLTQKDFVKRLGRSPGWMTKALKEAAAREAAKAAAEADG
ncbi:hypothetical protein ABZ023_34710, partial [Streptomyces sp. NPDC006367]